MDRVFIDVLFIDDEQAFLNVLVKRLEKRHIRASIANSGAAGLERLSRHPVDIVVLDVCMPGMDGLETLRRIKAENPFSEVILLTGNTCVETARQGMEEGAFDYLMKPVEIDDLIYRLEDAYDKIQLIQAKPS
ncbi:MAG: response regulator [Desulfobacterales bacterium]|nr:response regulator [Desulfobacterales bacterium]